MNNENFKVGSRATVKTCAENSENFGWGFRVGETVVIIDRASVPQHENAEMIAVESIERGMLGYFLPDELSAI